MSNREGGRLLRANGHEGHAIIAFSNLSEALEAERAWLATQPPFDEGWEKGCAWVKEKVDTWAEKFKDEMKLGDLDASSQARCSLRLWDAWAYHWWTAAHDSERKADDGQRIDGQLIANRLEEGVYPTMPKKPMGGKPLRDVFLAEAVLARSGPALELFYREYHALFSKVARKVVHQEPEEDQWQDLVTDLVLGSPEDVRFGHQGRLAAYQGYGSLKGWLRPVVHHYLIDLFRRKRTRRLAEQRFAAERSLSTEGDHDEGLELRAAFDAFARGMAPALADLPVIERRVLTLRFQEDRPNVAVAKAIAKCPGQTSRIQQRATWNFIGKLRKHLGASVAASSLLDKIIEGDVVRAGQFLKLAFKESLREKTPIDDSPMEEKGHAMPTTLVPPRTIRLAPSSPEERPAPESKAPPPPARPAPERSAQEEAVVVPDNLRHLIPDDVLVANQSEHPMEVFHRLRKESPAVLCLDARADSFGPVELVKWQEVFGALFPEGNDGPDEDPAPPRRVVFHRISKERFRSDLSATRCSSDVEFWLAHPDVEWVETSDPTDDLPALYRRMLVRDFEALFAPRVPVAPCDPPSPNAKDLIDFLPENERQGWMARLKEIQGEGAHS